MSDGWAILIIIAIGGAVWVAVHLWPDNNPPAY